jgi:membrane protein implicated in regulation of membrane protease activity
MLESLSQNLQAFWLSVGFALLVVDALAFGFSSGALLFAGLGALITGALLWAGLLPAGWTASIACFGIASTTAAVLLWRVLRRLQDGSGEPPRDVSSDLIGYRFRLREAIDLQAPGRMRYSGVDWRVEIDDTAGVERIEAQRQVEVVSVSAGVFRVRPAAAALPGIQSPLG